MSIYLQALLAFTPILLAALLLIPLQWPAKACHARGVNRYYGYCLFCLGNVI